MTFKRQYITEVNVIQTRQQRFNRPTIRPLSDTVPLCCDPEVASVHLFTLATMAVCFVADCKHNNRKDKCRFFFGFRLIKRNTRSGKTLCIKF